MTYQVSRIFQLENRSLVLISRISLYLKEEALKKIHTYKVPANLSITYSYGSDVLINIDDFEDIFDCQPLFSNVVNPALRKRLEIKV
jgi:hypothetical protein